jgi:1,4-dihydroxy-6-naphthoate synthase
MTSINKNMIKVAHSPDSDDAFMFFALAEKKIDLDGLEYYFGSSEIENLNQLALKSSSKPTYDVFAISFHAYSYLHDRFQILKSGASMGSRNHGPKLIVNKIGLENFNKNKSLNDLYIAVPGALTSANLCLNIYAAEKKQTINPLYCSFNEVFKLLDEGVVSAALLIHESQLQYEEHGYQLILDLGAWWSDYSGGLNLPLGTNVINRDLNHDLRLKISSQLGASIRYGLENFEITLNYARNFSQNGLNDTKAKTYIDMYVNNSTKELSENDLKSIKLFYSAAQKYNLIEAQGEIPLDII